MNALRERLKWVEYWVESAHGELMARMPETLTEREIGIIDQIVRDLEHLKNVSKARTE